MLTSTQARDAKPRAKQYELSCDALPGFLLRVLPSGKKVFFVRYRDGGKDVRERLGLMGPDFGVEAARKAALAVLAGGSPAEEPRAIEAPRGARRRAHAEPEADEPAPATAPKRPLAGRSPEPHTGPQPATAGRGPGRPAEPHTGPHHATAGRRRSPEPCTGP
jgi:hypothetical protein